MNRTAWLAPLVVFAFAMTLYSLTLAPTLSWAHFGTDGGDLITAAATLGVAHPPGYPVYVTLGHWFAQLPIGDVAYRLNLMSAMCMALAAALTSLGLTRALLSIPTGVAVLGGLTFAAAPMVWGQATIAEVHALNALFAAAILCLLVPMVFRSEAPSARQLALAFFLWGLGLANQLTLIALAPVFFVAVRRSFLASRFSRTTHHVLRITQYALLFLLGLSSYLLLLLRAAAHPPVNWLGAVTAPNFWSLITAEVYRGYAFAAPLNAYPTRLIAFAQAIVAQFGWIGLGVGVVGVISTGRRGATLIVSALLYLLFALGYNTADSQLYLIPIWLCAAWAIAIGAQVLIQRVPLLRLHPTAGSLIGCALIPGLIVVTNFAAQDLRADRTAEDFAHTIETQAPADAIIISYLDAHSFTLWYYRQVEAQRRDTVVIDARLAGYTWYEPMLRAQDNTLNVVAFDPEATWLARLHAANPTRPVCGIDATTARLQCD